MPHINWISFVTIAAVMAAWTVLWMYCYRCAQCRHHFEQAWEGFAQCHRDLDRELDDAATYHQARCRHADRPCRGGCAAVRPRLFAATGGGCSIGPAGILGKLAAQVGQSPGEQAGYMHLRDAEAVADLALSEVAVEPHHEDALFAGRQLVHVSVD